VPATADSLCIPREMKPTYWSAEARSPELAGDAFRWSRGQLLFFFFGWILWWKCCSNCVGGYTGGCAGGCVKSCSRWAMSGGGWHRVPDLCSKCWLRKRRCSALVHSDGRPKVVELAAPAACVGGPFHRAGYTRRAEALAPVVVEGPSSCRGEDPLVFQIVHLFPWVWHCPHGH
jgi:hypothetical protein